MLRASVICLCLAAPALAADLPHVSPQGVACLARVNTDLPANAGDAALRAAIPAYAACAGQTTPATICADHDPLACHGNPAVAASVLRVTLFLQVVQNTLPDEDRARFRDVAQAGRSAAWTQCMAAHPVDPGDDLKARMMAERASAALCNARFAAHDAAVILGQFAHRRGAP